MMTNNLVIIRLSNPASKFNSPTPILPTHPKPHLGYLRDGGFQQVGSGASFGSLKKYTSVFNLP